MREAPTPTRPGNLRLFWLSGALVLAFGLTNCGARTGIELLDSIAPNAGAKAALDPSQPQLGGAGASGASGASGGASQCVAVDVSIEDLRPAITIMVDQSRSMRSGFPTRNSPTTRWSLVGQALFDPTRGVVKTYEARVRFGIAFFTGHSGSCPLLNEVSAATGNYGALNALYQRLGPDGDTPTGESLEQVTNELLAMPTQGPRSIVLVTDGNPDTCAQPQPDNGQLLAVSAVQRAHAAGIDVYILGVSNDIAGGNLQQLANAGKGKPLDLVWGVDAAAAQPYQASTSALGLATQLGEILDRIPLCQVNLQRDVASAEASTGHVTLDGQALGYSDTNGYDLRGARSLEIVGQACDTLKSSGKQLSVRIACD
ncbi:MAG: vWA domain-containing protein [Myxococcales bacterium]